MFLLKKIHWFIIEKIWIKFNWFIFVVTLHNRINLQLFQTKQISNDVFLSFINIIQNSLIINFINAHQRNMTSHVIFDEHGLRSNDVYFNLNISTSSSTFTSNYSNTFAKFIAIVKMNMCWIKIIVIHCSCSQWKKSKFRNFKLKFIDRKLMNDYFKLSLVRWHTLDARLMRVFACKKIRSKCCFINTLKHW